MNFHEHKKARTEYYEKYVKGCDDVFSFVQEKVAQLTGIAMKMDTKASYARFSAVNSVFEAIQNI